MKEGTVPFLPFRPCALRDDDVLLFRTYRIFWGAQSGGGDTPVVGSSFFDRFQ
jgi:hypothetical protein